MARSCIGLLLECADYLATHQTNEGGVAGKGEGPGKEGAADEVVKSKLKKEEGAGEGRGLFWKTLRNGLTSNSWTTRFKTSQ